MSMLLWSFLLAMVQGGWSSVAGAAEQSSCAVILAGAPSSDPNGVESMIAEAWADLLTKDRVLSESERDWLLAIAGGADPFSPDAGLFESEIRDAIGQLGGVVEKLVDEGTASAAALRVMILARSREVLGQSEDAAKVQEKAAWEREEYGAWFERIQDSKRRTTAVLELVRRGRWDVLAAALQDQGDNQWFLRSISQILRSKILRTANATANPVEFADGMAGLLRIIIGKADEMTLNDLALWTFSEPDTAQMEDLVGLVIAKAGNDTLWHLATYTFSNPHTTQMKDLLRQVIERADHSTLSMLRSFTFIQPHTRSPGFEPFRQAIQIEDPVARREFLLRELGPASTSFDSSNFATAK